jgi:endonuclease/exonuclease/phosphatase (EEP) superfamily protein YafD
MWLAASSSLYLATLSALAVGLRLWGERRWWTVILLYLPRAPLALPLAALVPAALRRDRRRWLAVHAAAALVLVFPLLGLRLGWPRPAPGSPSLRLMTFNVWFGWREPERIVPAIARERPDVVLIQGSNEAVEARLRAGFPGWHVHGTGDLVLVSRFPVGEIVETPPAAGSHGLVTSVRYTLETPLGALSLVGVHPFSARNAIVAVATEWRRILREGISADAVREVIRNRDQRAAQVGALVAVAAQAPGPVVIAGDTNLPGLDPLLDDALGGFRDGFAQAGAGFGYTFPAHRAWPWMRIDRVLTGPGLRVTAIHVGDFGISDHAPVIAEIARR